MSTEQQEEGVISDEQAEIYNRQACNMVSIFFKELATLTPEQIYSAASKEDGAESILLESINRVFTQFLENGKDLPQVYFDSYIRTVESFVHTFKLNIENKLEQNSNILIAQAVGKEEVSYKDIADAIIVLPPEEDPKE